MRELTSHRVNGLNEALRITVLDEPGPGGACYKYEVHTHDSWEDGERREMGGAGGDYSCTRISFQLGPIAESGVNGVSNEALLAILEDRLLGFQTGAYSCRENAIALTKLQEALMWLQKRTRDRLARGVEGTSQK